jgi:hypothetical protein
LEKTHEVEMHEVEMHEEVKNRFEEESRQSSHWFFRCQLRTGNENGINDCRWVGLKLLTT